MAVANYSPPTTLIRCEHTLPVTCVVMGTGGINALVASASLDRTVKLYSLTLKNVLLAGLSALSRVSLAPFAQLRGLWRGGRVGMGRDLCDTELLLQSELPSIVRQRPESATLLPSPALPLSDFVS